MIILVKKLTGAELFFLEFFFCIVPWEGMIEFKTLGGVGGGVLFAGGGGDDGDGRDGFSGGGLDFFFLEFFCGGRFFFFVLLFCGGTFLGPTQK